MATPRYLIAQYMPDLLRQEPRNIGVVVWSPSGMASRFVAENAEQPGRVNGAPSFVNNPSAYKQWIEFWTREINKEFIIPARGGAPVARSSMAFLDALKSTSKGNFLLVDGGNVLDHVQGAKLPSLAQYLFDLLVS